MRLKLSMMPCLLVINVSNILGGSPPILFYVYILYSNMNFFLLDSILEYRRLVIIHKILVYVCAICLLQSKRRNGII